MRVLIYRHESGVTNFGDELNLYLWDKLLPQIGSVLRPDLIFLGIGTLLKADLPPGPKLVFGAGAGYGRPPTINSTWDIRFVRGRLTAGLLKLPPEKAITDPGILVGLMRQRSTNPRHRASFMPRFTNVTPEIRGACKVSNIYLIDPRGAVETVLDEIADSELLLTEALHGAIVADALRIPWVPIRIEHGHDFKWYDWLSMLGVTYRPLPAGVLKAGWITAAQERQLSDPAVATGLLYRILAELQTLRAEIKDRRGPFAEDSMGAIPGSKMS